MSALNLKTICETTIPIQPPSRIRIKMCGMTRAIDIAHAISLGVDAIGLILYQQSARHVTLEQAKQLLQGLPEGIDAIAVLVNPTTSFVHKVIAELPIQGLQFHGEETPLFCEQFGLPYMKAIPATSTNAIRKAMDDHQHAAAILLDTPSITSRGGSGMSFDWQKIPRILTKSFMLAGGLDALNVAKAISICSPYGVDVCSGIEESPRIKDHDKMNAFIDAVWGKNERKRTT